MLQYIDCALTLVHDPARCTNCRRCLDVCPHGVFALEDKQVRPLGRSRCIECGACALNCPESAITVEAGVGCAEAELNALITGGPPSCGCSDEGGGCC